jgi:hypothetical protein
VRFVPFFQPVRPKKLRLLTIGLVFRLFYARFEDSGNLQLSEGLARPFAGGLLVDGEGSGYLASESSVLGLIYFRKSALLRTVVVVAVS